ncbi:hypothetical protein M5K25_018845 [Dendrobium thyrsiflorum]|uniref:Uncharacterized protein n=1 Tax=Dendrobium thyrsiflorum TaxID=117978 RepID=A0ABD0UE48_DENTH
MGEPTHIGSMSRMKRGHFGGMLIALGSGSLSMVPSLYSQKRIPPILSSNHKERFQSFLENGGLRITFK